LPQAPASAAEYVTASLRASSALSSLATSNTVSGAPGMTHSVTSADSCAPPVYTVLEMPG
jgi:hypothetical protein